MNPLFIYDPLSPEVTITKKISIKSSQDRDLSVIGGLQAARLFYYLPPMDWFHEFRTNENHALTEIYRLYRKDCVALARRKFGLSQEDAIDVFQHSVLILYHNTATGKLITLTSDIKSYLVGIMRLKAFEAKRASSKTVYPEDLNATLATIPDVPPEEESGMITLLKSLLPKLGTSCRELLDMYYYKELNLNEIAKIAEYSGPDSVKTQKYKCIKRLHSMIMEHISVQKN